MTSKYLPPFPLKSGSFKDKEPSSWYTQVQTFTNDRNLKIPKASVNFNGTGSVAIRNENSVASITDNGTGTYTINLEDTLESTDTVVVYATANLSEGSGLASNAARVVPAAITTTSVRVIVVNNSDALADAEVVHVGITGDVVT